MRTIQLAPALLCQHQELERHRQCLGPAARAFGHALTEPHGREARLDGVARAQMLPVFILYLPKALRPCNPGSAGKSKKASKASLSLIRQSTTLSYLGENSATKASMPRSAWARVSAYMISCSARLARPCKRLGSLSRTLAILWHQSRCSRVAGHTSRTASQKPSAPSPTAKTGACIPRRFRSRSTVFQLSALSR